MTMRSLLRQTLALMLLVALRIRAEGPYTIVCAS